jgi:hypothetical protein
MTPVEPASKPMSWGGKLALGLLTSVLVASAGWAFWGQIYWGSPPPVITTETATVWGTVSYGPAYYGDYHYTLETLDGTLIGLSCQPVWTEYIHNACLEPLAASGLAEWRPDARKPGRPGPLVEVGFVWAPGEPRFNAVAVSARRAGVDYLKREARLAEAGLNASGTQYSEIRYRQAQRRRLAKRQAQAEGLAGSSASKTPL